jgi:glycine hydroxymethyltransferase
VTSGIRLGSPACTSRGFGQDEFREVGKLIADVLDGLGQHGEEHNFTVETKVKEHALALTRRFPIYS